MDGDYDVIVYCGQYNRNPVDSFGIVRHDIDLPNEWMVHTSGIPHHQASNIWHKLVSESEKIGRYNDQWINHLGVLP